MKRTLALILATLLLTSSMSISAFAADETEPTANLSTETEVPENENSEINLETPCPEVIPEKKEEPHTITIAHRMMEQGYVIPNRRSAKEGEVIILTAVEREYERNGKQYKYEFGGWYSDANVSLIYVSKTMAFFFMPDEDVTIYPVFREVDVTEYYDWESVEKAIVKLRRNQSLDVDMQEETSIPESVLKALSGKDADVTFTTEDCIYTINGMNINLSDTSSGYSITYKDYELSKLQSRKIRNTDLLSIKVNVDTNHEIKAELRCFASKDKDTGYLYRVNGQNFTFLSVIDIKNGEAIIPVTESGVYVVVSQALADTKMQFDADSNNVVAIVGGKLLPISAVIDNKLTFKIETPGKIMFSEYTNTYTDVKNHKYKSQIDFVTARGILDGVTADTWQPNAGITTGEFMRAVARLRGIPDKDAYDYCTQLDIFTYEYVEDALLTRNEMSVIFTNFINHLIEYPKSFGGYSMKGFSDNGAAWVGARFKELKNDSPISYDWKEYASRAEAAYLLQVAVQTIVAGD